LEDVEILLESFSALHLAETSKRAEAVAALFSLSSVDPSVARVATVLSSCFVEVDRSALSALLGVSKVGMDRLMPLAVIHLFVFIGVTIPAVG
jgi:anti-anti-sigma regulatory factor